MKQVRRVALVVTALVTTTGVATAGEQRELTPAERLEKPNREYCQQIDLSTLHDNDAGLSAVNDSIGACIHERQALLASGDGTTRNLSRTSAVGGVGAVVSGLTAQAAGTTNAWLAIGLAPMIADDVQQRRRKSEIAHELVARLTQLQCRANFLYNEQSYMLSDVRQLREDAATLEALVARVQTHVNFAAAAATPEGRLAAIYSEAMRLVEQAALLDDYVSALQSDHEVVRLEAISYNYYAAEHERMHREALARPEMTFRSILAAPLRVAANVVGGTASATTLSYTSPVTPSSATFAGRYSVASSLSQVDITAVNMRFAAPHYLRAPAARREEAQALIEAASRLSVNGVELRRNLLRFYNAATDQNPEACPTYQVVARPASPPTPPPPPSAPPSEDAAK